MKKSAVDIAIQKGHQKVNYPIFAIMIIGFGLTFYLLEVFNKSWIFLIGFFSTFILMWLWWSFNITKWRIWALENCRNVHELKRRAIGEKLIWPDGSMFEKTAIRTTEQNHKLSLLNKKFEIEDEINHIYDDNSVPNETKIYYSKFSLAYYWILGIALFSIGIFIGHDWTGYATIAISIFFLYSAYKKSNLKEPRITINNKGIKTNNLSFTTWKEIKNIYTELRHPGKYSKWHLIIELKKKKYDEWGDDFEISDLNMTPKEIENLILLYKQRNKKYL